MAAIVSGEGRLDPATARSLAERLLAVPPPRRVTLLRNSRRFARGEVCRALLDLALEQRFDDIAGMFRSVRAAVVVAEFFTQASLPQALQQDLRAEAWSVMGNAERIAGDSRDAWAAFRRAHRLLGKGTGDPLVTAQLLSFEGSLQLQEKRHNEASATFRVAGALYREVGDEPAAARQLIKLAGVQIDLDQHFAALGILQDAAKVAGTYADPVLTLTVVQNLVVCYSALGDTQAARAALQRLRRVGPSNLTAALRLQVVEARLARQHGDWDTAIHLFETLHEEFAGRGLELDALEAGLELGAMLKEAGEHRRLRRLVEDLYPVLFAKDLPAEALSAILLFIESVRVDAREAGLAERAVRILRDARRAKPRS